MKKALSLLSLFLSLSAFAQVDKVINLTITQPNAPLTVAGSVTNTTGFGLATGSIDITVSGGTAPYTYSWDSGQTTQDLTNIPAGDYEVTVTDANTCQFIDSFTVIQPPQLLVSLNSVSGVSCFGDTNGSLTVTASGGYPGYHYELFREQTPGNFVFTGDVLNSAGPFTVNGLDPGNYRVTVTDNNGAGIQANSAIIPVNEPAALSVSLNSVTNIGCTGQSTGSIDVSVSGGTSPYNYSWNAGAYTTQDLNNVPAGVYSLTVTDANGCQVSLFPPVQITEPALALSVSNPASSTLFNPTFAGASDGSIDISVSGGTGPYNYSWSNGAITQDISGLPEGIYTVTVTDANGCMAMQNYELTEPDPLIAQILVTQGILCNGDTNGSLTVNATGGVTAPGNEYDFLWTKTGEPGFSETTQAISNLTPGEYNVTVTDNNGISVGTSYELVEPTALSFTYNQTNNTCPDTTQGSVEFFPSGGTPPYTYSVNGVDFQAAASFPGLSAGSYTLIVQDANGCTATDAATITEPPSWSVNTLVSEITAFEYDNGAISVTVSGATSPYTYEWFADNGFASTDEDIANLAPGHYTLVIYDANYALSGGHVGCTYMQEFTLTEPDLLTVSVVEDVAIACFGATTGTLFADVAGGVPPYQYEWVRVTAGVPAPIGQTLQYASDLGIGDYQVTITDANGIQVVSSVYTLQQPPQLLIQVDAITDVLCYGDATGAIDISILGGTPPYTISWNNGAVSEDIADLTAGSYTVTVTDANSCVAMEQAEVAHVSAALTIDNAVVTNVTSFGGTNGSISIAFSGGSAPHTVEWVRLSDNAVVGNTTNLTNLPGDDYEITIIDANGCTLSATYTVMQPDIVEPIFTLPLCYGSCEGSIELIPTVEEPLTYSWNTGDTGTILTNQCAGTYTVTITGFGPEPLVRVYELLNPELLTINVGPDRTLCVDQTLDISAAIADPGATYSWTGPNGFVSNQSDINVSDAGIYSVTVTNSNGCEAQDNITVQRTTDVIDATFLVASQGFAGESLVLVDVSDPLPDSVEWILPNEAVVITENTDYAEVVFQTPGEYEVGILTRRGACEATQLKRVLVLDGQDFGTDSEPNLSFIEDFTVFPNPSSGIFSVRITLQEAAPVNLKIFGLANNTVITDVTSSGGTDYEIPFNLAPLASGIYAVVLETPFGSQIRKIIIE